MEMYPRRCEATPSYAKGPAHTDPTSYSPHLWLNVLLVTRLINCIKNAERIVSSCAYGSYDTLSTARVEV